VLLASNAAADGRFRGDGSLPVLEPGSHVTIVRATVAGGQATTVAGGVRVDAARRVVAVAQPRALVDAVPADPRVLRALDAGKPPYDPAADPVATAAVGTAGAVALGLVALGVPVPAPRPAPPAARRKSSVKGVVTKKIKSVEEVPDGPGDRSRTWRWPLTARTDRFTRWLPTVGATRTGVVARLALDGVGARVVLGSLGYLTWVVALVLGVLGALFFPGSVVAPPLAVLLALVVVGMIDASAGAVAWLAMTVTSLATGSVGTTDDVRTLLGLGSLMVCPVLVSNAIRPIRRPHWRDSDGGRFARFADYVVAPVLVAFLAGGMAKALNGLSGLELVTDETVTAVRWAAGCTVVLRYLLEDVTALRYPRRTRELASPDLPRPAPPWRLAGILLGAAVFVAEPFFGLTASLLLAAALSAVPGVLTLWEDRLPNSERLYRWLPRGMLKPLILMVLSAYLTARLIADGGDDAVRSTLILMLLPGLAFGIVAVFARDGRDWPDTIARRLAGAATWTALLALTTGAVTLFA
jgi:hypothetical protein